jgi:type III restriction enzyme
VDGLNRCGFSDLDYRVGNSQSAENTDVQNDSLDAGSLQTDFIDILSPESASSVSEATQAIVGDGIMDKPSSGALLEIEKVAQAAVEKAATSSAVSSAVAVLADNLPDVKTMRIEFVEKANQVALPSFFIEEDAGLFNDELGKAKPLTRQDLVRGFKLTNQDTNLDFRPSEMEIFEVDINSDAAGVSRPEYTRLSDERARRFAALVSHLSDADQKRELFAILSGVLSRFDEIPERDIRSYLRRVIDAQEQGRLADMMENPYKYAELLKFKVQTLMTAYAIASFNRRAVDNTLLARGAWHFPKAIQAPNAIRGLRRSLYVEEAEVNHFELEVAHEIAGLDNVVFWHRNLERKGFCLNGYVNHYPDFILLTKKNNVILVESKGDDRNNDDSTLKLKLGKAWENKAGQSFKYFMVFQNIHVEGAYAKNQLATTAGRL